MFIYIYNVYIFIAYAYICHNFFFIHPSTYGHLDRFHVATVNNAAMNLGVQVSFEVNVFITFDYVLRGRIAGSYVILFLIFLSVIWRYH